MLLLLLYCSLPSHARLTFSSFSEPLTLSTLVHIESSQSRLLFTFLLTITALCFATILSAATLTTNINAAHIPNIINPYITSFIQPLTCIDSRLLIYVSICHLIHALNTSYIYDIFCFLCHKYKTK